MITSWHSRRKLWAWSLLLLVLASRDSFVFAQIQNNPGQSHFWLLDLFRSAPPSPPPPPPFFLEEDPSLRPYYLRSSRPPRLRPHSFSHAEVPHINPAPFSSERPLTFLILGDNLAQLLEQVLALTFSQQKNISFHRFARANTGLVRRDYFDWLKEAEILLNKETSVDFALIMIGSNDSQKIYEDSKAYDVSDPHWKEIYMRRVDHLMRLFQEKKIPLLWIGMPIMKNPSLRADMLVLNTIFRQAADRFGVTYLDIWDVFATSEGQYKALGPDVQGHITQLRSKDGVHFTPDGVQKLAFFVLEKLKNLLLQANYTLTYPDPSSSLSSSLPLSPSKKNETLDLFAVPLAPDSTLITMPLSSSSSTLSSSPSFSKAPEGRSDDFSWPK